MENNKEYLDQLAEIRRMMEKSSKFMSLSGFSGIFLGLYALAGSWVTMRILDSAVLSEMEIVLRIGLTALIMMTASLATALWLSMRQARKAGHQAWGPGSRQLLSNLLLPLSTGGIFVILLVTGRYFSLVAPALLVFYGLALAIAARYTHRELFFAGLAQILLGLVALALPQYGLLLWAAGFGVVHILYGIYMYIVHEREPLTPEK